MKRNFAFKTLLLVLTLAFCLPGAAQAMQREVIFKNNSGRHILFAVIHLANNGSWMKGGWFEIRPGGSYSMNDYFGSDKLYVYATDKDGKFAWPDQRRKQGLQQTVQDDAFYASDKTRFGKSVYFQQVNIAKYSRYTWVFQ